MRGEVSGRIPAQTPGLKMEWVWEKEGQLWRESRSYMKSLWLHSIFTGFRNMPGLERMSLGVKEGAPRGGSGEK